MTEIRKADPAARRRAVLLVSLGALVGTLLIAGFERYSPTLREWLLSEPAELARRVKLLSLLSAAVLSTPLVGFAVYLWLLGGKVLRWREFPPPGYRVLRDTTVFTGEAARLRGRVLKGLALGLGVASVSLWVLFWRLAVLVSEGAA